MKLLIVTITRIYFTTSILVQWLFVFIELNMNVPGFHKSDKVRNMLVNDNYRFSCFLIFVLIFKKIFSQAAISS